MATLEQQLIEWSLMEAYLVDQVIFFSSAPTLWDTVDIVWPDDSPGVLKTLTFGIFDHQYVALSRQLTYGSTDLVVLESAPSLDAEGRVLIDRAATVLSNLSAFGVAPFGTRSFGA